MNIIQFSKDNVPAGGFPAAFNTCRVGTKYAKTLKPGDRVSVRQTESGAELFEAEVTGLTSGVYDDIVRDHVGMNIAGNEYDLAEQLDRAYGRLFHERAVVTFVYLRRV